MDCDEIKVIIADDQVSTRRALKAVLEFEPRIAVIGEAPNGKEAVRLAGEQQPDLVLMDARMPVLNGVDATRIIKSNWPNVKVVVYTLYPEYQEEAVRAGADCFLIKGSPEFSPPEAIKSLFPTRDTLNPDPAARP